MDDELVFFLSLYHLDLESSPLQKPLTKPRYLKYTIRQPHSPAVCTSLNMFADRGTGQNSPVSLDNLSFALVAKISIHIFNPPSPDDYLSDSFALLLI